MNTQTESRSLSIIARDIKRTWPNVNFAAVPYLDAMLTLDNIAERYYEDSGESIVAYFLSNASTWRGNDARRIKAELNAMLKSARHAR